MKQVEKQRVAMEQAIGIWVKTKLLRSSLSRNYHGANLTEDYSRCLKLQVWTNVSGFFFLIYSDVRFVVWSAPFLLPLGLLTRLAKFANTVWAANLHRRVLVWVKGWYVRRGGAQRWFQRRVDWFGLWMRPNSNTHKNKGSSVSACKVMCQEMHPAPKHARTFIWGGMGAQWHCLSVGTPPDPATASICILLLSCSSPCSPFLSVFYYCMELLLPAAAHRKPFTS